jgi:EmrB/QacA subfamily drug resistance transporter
MAMAFGVPPVRLNLAITSYVVCLAIFIPMSGWLSDRVGAKRLFTWAIVVFIVGSILCGLSDSFGMLIAARIVQGIGGALMTPSGRLILLRTFSKKELVSAISYMTMPVLIGPLLGPLLGGFLTTYASWRWIFYINIPIGLIGLMAARRFIPDLPPEPRQRFDGMGFVLCASALLLLQIALENLIHPVLPPLSGYLLFPASVVVMFAFWRYARQRAAPVLDIGLLLLRPFRSGVLFGGISRISLNAVPFLLQLKLQLGLGYSPIHAGALVFITAFGSLSLKFFTQRILRATGFRTLLSVNAAVGGLLTAGFAAFGAGSPAWLLCGYIFLVGFARSLQFNAINALTYADVPKERQSGSVALAGCAQQISMGLGVSLSAVLLASHKTASVPSLATFDTAFVVMGALSCLSLLGFLTMKAEDGRETSGHVPRPGTPIPHK